MFRALFQARYREATHKPENHLYERSYERLELTDVILTLFLPFSVYSFSLEPVICEDYYYLLLLPIIPLQ